MVYFLLWWHCNAEVLCRCFYPCLDQLQSHKYVNLLPSWNRPSKVAGECYE